MHSTIWTIKIWPRKSRSITSYITSLYVTVVVYTESLGGCSLRLLPSPRRRASTLPVIVQWHVVKIGDQQHVQHWMAVVNPFILSSPDGNVLHMACKDMHTLNSVNMLITWRVRGGQHW